MFQSSTRSLSQIAINQMASDHHALNLICPLKNLHHFGFAHVPLNGMIACISSATEDLDRIGCNPHDGVCCDEFRDARFPAKRLT
jgi:hypothetical protein